LVLKQGDALSPLLFEFALEYANTKIQENQQGLELYMADQLLLCADYVVLICENIRSIKKNMEILLFGSNVTSLEVIASAINYVHLMSYIFRTTILHIQNLTPTFAQCFLFVNAPTHVSALKTVRQIAALFVKNFGVLRVIGRVQLKCDGTR
jgi:hypothetical protein